MREAATDHDWCEWAYEEWKKKLEALGYHDVDIRFSGFWSQGDGASFTAKRVDLKTWLKAHKLSNKYRTLYNAGEHEYELSVARSTAMPYVHAYMIDAVGEWLNGYDKPAGLEQMDAMIELVTEDARDLSNQIYRDLEAEYDGLTCDEALFENADANGYEFDRRGRPAAGAMSCLYESAQCVGRETTN